MPELRLHRLCLVHFIAFLCLFISPEFLFSQEMKPSETEALVNVVVTNKSGSPREGEIISFNSVKTKKAFSCTTKENGRCSLLLPKGDKYDVRYKRFGDQVSYRQIDVPAGDSKVTFTYTLKYDSPRVYTLKNVFFDTGKATIRNESFAALDELVEAMKLNRNSSSRLPAIQIMWDRQNQTLHCRPTGQMQ